MVVDKSVEWRCETCLRDLGEAAVDDLGKGAGSAEHVLKHSNWGVQMT